MGKDTPKTTEKKARIVAQVGPKDPILEGEKPSISISWEVPREDLVAEGKVSFSIRLGPGLHRLPFGSSDLLVEVLQGCEAFGEIEVRRTDRPRFSGATLEFSRPLRLRKVLLALLEVQRFLGEEGLLERLMGLSGLMGEVSRAIALLLEEGGAEVVDRSVAVDLAKVLLRPSKDGRTLQPSFCGKIEVGHRSWPFSFVALPETVFPAFSSDLGAIVHGRLFQDGKSFPFGPLVSSIYRLLASGMLEVHAFILAPDLDILVTQGDETKTEVEISLSERPLKVFGRFSFAPARGGDYVLKVDHLEVERDTRPFFEAQGLLSCSPVQGEMKKWDLRVKGALHEVKVRVRRSHPLVEGEQGLYCLASISGLEGNLKSQNLEQPFDKGALRMKILVEVPGQEVIKYGGSKWEVSPFSGLVDLRLRASRGQVEALAHIQGAPEISFIANLTPIPEVHLPEPRLHCKAGFSLSGKVGLWGSFVPQRGFALEGTRWEMAFRVLRFLLELGGFRLLVPRGSKVVLRQASDPGEEVRPVVVSYNLCGPPRIRAKDGKAFALLAEELRKGEFEVALSPSGRLSFEAKGGGPYGLRFLKALLDPASEPRHLLAVFESQEALSYVCGVLSLFNTNLAEALAKASARISQVRGALKEKGVRRPGDILSPQGLSWVLSLILFGDERAKERLTPIIEEVLEGKGVAVEKASEILREVPLLRDADYEIKGILNLLDLILRAGAPLEGPKPTTFTRRLKTFEGVPSAKDIAAASMGKVPLSPEMVAFGRFMRTLQVEGLIRGGIGPQDLVAHLRRVLEVKRLADRIEAEGYGALAHAGQAAAIARFIGAAVRADPPVLGPREVAIFLLSGTSQAVQGTQAQVNNRLLMDFMAKESRDFCLGVFVEMGQQVRSALASALFAFLHQDQHRMKEPLDLEAFLEERLGIEVPRQEDYLAGGRLASKSYYEALLHLAEQIVLASESYLSMRAHIQEIEPPLPRPPKASLGRDAKKAIAEADRLGRRFLATQAGRNEAIRAYKEAFAACAAFLREEPLGFTLPWFRAFWARNEEALKVLSVVRNYEEDVDKVRPWLHLVSGRESFKDEQDLLETVVRVLWAREGDQQTLLSDPLVRLLIDPEEGHYRFAVVGCMGVITDGEEGSELETAFSRLEARRGIKVIRAATGLFRPLEYNAKKVLEAIKKADGMPFGLLGYSQGCANALMAEHIAITGTLEEQRLMEGLVCRNFLFSAANGSAHGSSGMRKFEATMVEGERFLKHYQAVLSRQAIDLFYRFLRMVFDSPGFLWTLSGAHSLTLERAQALHRDGRFRCDVPTSTTRGIAPKEWLPDALTYLYACHEALMPGVPHDSQVAVEDAVGHATRVVTQWTKAFALCDMGSVPLKMHHWAPVTKEVEPVETENDRRRLVYQGPKDILVFPWVEVNARFGRIKTV